MNCRGEGQARWIESPADEMKQRAASVQTYIRDEFDTPDQKLERLKEQYQR